MFLWPPAHPHQLLQGSRLPQIPDGQHLAPPTIMARINIKVALCQPPLLSCLSPAIYGLARPYHSVAKAGSILANSSPPAVGPMIVCDAPGPRSSCGCRKTGIHVVPSPPPSPNHHPEPVFCGQEQAALGIYFPHLVPPSHRPYEQRYYNSCLDWKGIGHLRGVRSLPRVPWLWVARLGAYWVPDSMLISLVCEL